MSATPLPPAGVGELLNVLTLETIELDVFYGRSPDTGERRIYGGQVVAQALTAAYQTIEARICHSLHGYFIRPGDPTIPILLQVERVRDGGSFAVRRVVAIQHGQQIFNLAASFQTPEQGFEHQFDMPEAPDPETLKNEEQLRAQAGRPPRHQWPVEVRPIRPPEPGRPASTEPRSCVWFRARTGVGEGVAANQCALAYASDMTLLDTAIRPHRVDFEELQVASLDHALWFHGPSDLTDWHLYVQDSPSASGGRGFNRGLIFTRDGRLVASAAQEGLMRRRRPQ